MGKPNILIVEDDITQRMVIRQIVSNMGKRQQAVEVTNGEEAINYLKRDSEHDIKAMLLDLYMPVKDGFDVLAWVKENRADVAALVLTGSDEAEDIDRAMDLGAYDFVPKPADQERIHVSLRNALNSYNLHEEVERLQRIDEGYTIFSDMIGHDAGLSECIAIGKKAAASDIPVLIQGQSGVGKELFARAIHGESARSKKPFVAVNCGAIPENLVESILFGHKKGSFTGAIADSPGKFREASGGTLFLDEVGELPADVQVKLLRALQQKEIEPVGEAKPVNVDVRIVSATNRVLEDEVRQSNFREDLYFRLNVFPVRIPSLKKRTQDIPPLVEFFIQKFATTEHKDISCISEEALEALKLHDWVGNIRELENAVFRAVVMCEDEQLNLEDFQFLARLRAHIQPKSQGAEARSDKGFSVLHEDGTHKTMDEIELEIIDLVIAQNAGNVTAAAKQLAVGQSTLYRKLNDRKEAQQTNDEGDAQAS